MREQFLPDGSKNYGQGVIGPSAQDIAFFNNPGRSPLDHFPTRQTLTTTAIIVTPFAVSGCISVSPAKTGEVQQSAGGETSLSGEISIGDRFDSFLTLYNDKQTEIGVVEAWIDALGIPKSAIKYDDTYDFLSSPLEATTAYFSIIPNDGIRPSKGDIAVISPTSDYANGTLGIATGDQESFEGNLYERVFMHYNGNPNTIDSFSPYDILAWLKPKDTVETNGQGDQGNDVLVARKESVAEHFQSFIDKYSGKFVEKNDASNLNQCMDLVTAWADELGIPRDAVTGLLYAKNLYLTPKKSTKDYFEIIPYEGGSTPQVGDVVVWDEGIGGVAGHAAIANGLGSTDTFEAFSQNYPTGSLTHTEDFRFDHVLGWLRPKGFGPRPQEPKLTKEPEQAGEFVPSNPEEFARYHFTDQLLENYLTGTNGRTNPEEDWRTADTLFTLTSAINLPENEKERIKQTLAKGERVKGPIAYYHYIVDQQHIFHEGDVYVVPIQLAIVDFKNANLVSEEFLNKNRLGFGMQTDEVKSVWAGSIKFSGEIRYGVVDLVVKGTQEDFENIELGTFTSEGTILLNFDFAGFDNITKFSPWETRQVSFDIISYDDGTLECRSNIREDGISDLELCLDRDEAEGLAGVGIFDLLSIPESEVRDSNGYNGQFVVKL